MSYLLDEKVDVYKTSEFSLICTLVYFGFQIVGFEQKPEDRGRVFSIFNKSAELEKAIEDYWSDNILVEARKFTQISRDIKARIKAETNGYGR